MKHRDPSSVRRAVESRQARVIATSRTAFDWSKGPLLVWLRALAWQWIGVVVAVVGALVLFAKIGEDVFDHESGTFDGVIRDWVLAHQTPLGVKLFTAITISGGTVPMIVFATGIAVWLWQSRGRHIAAVVVSAAAVSTAAFVAVKEIFVRVRPIGALAFLHRVTYSFPSGHATVSAAVLASTGYVMWRERLVPGRVVLWIGVTVVLLVGLSRVYLDLHWATDVLSGWCLGLGVAAASAALYEHWRPRERAPADAPA